MTVIGNENLQNKRQNANGDTIQIICAVPFRVLLDVEAPFTSVKIYELLKMLKASATRIKAINYWECLKRVGNVLLGQKARKIYDNIYMVNIGGPSHKLAHTITKY